MYDADAMHHEISKIRGIKGIENASQKMTAVNGKGIATASIINSCINV